jgi:hypothetical protein
MNVYELGKNEAAAVLNYITTLEAAAQTPQGLREALEQIRAIDGGMWGDDSPLWKVEKILAALSSTPMPVPSDEVVWPQIKAPPKVDNPAEGWEDPALPDFTKMNAVAREFGYSIALHGSMKRDVDLVAIPWVEDAADPDLLVSHLCGALDARRLTGWEKKPNGRIAINLQINGWFKMIDLSVMPRQAAPVEPLHGGLRLPDDKRVEVQHGERCAEGTRRPIWLLQTRRYEINHDAAERCEPRKL